MSCRELGGSCELIHESDDVNNIIKMQSKHLKDSVKSGDLTHIDALNAMKGRWRNPISELGWYNEIKRRFESL